MHSEQFYLCPSKSVTLSRIKIHQTPVKNQKNPWFIALATCSLYIWLLGKEVFIRFWTAEEAEEPSLQSDSSQVVCFVSWCILAFLPGYEKERHFEILCLFLFQSPSCMLLEDILIDTPVILPKFHWICNCWHFWLQNSLSCISSLRKALKCLLFRFIPCSSSTI